MMAFSQRYYVHAIYSKVASNMTEFWRAFDYGLHLSGFAFPPGGFYLRNMYFVIFTYAQD